MNNEIAGLALGYLEWATRRTEPRISSTGENLTAQLSDKEKKVHEAALEVLLQKFRSGKETA